jgi:hypothetical protein
MKKMAEGEVYVKLVTRDPIVRIPLTAVHRFRRELAEKDVQTTQSKLRSS